MDTHETTGTSNDAEITTGGGASARDDDIVSGPVPVTGKAVGGIDTGQQASCRQQYPTRVVWHLEGG